MSEAKFTKGEWIGMDDDGCWPEMYPWSVDNEDWGTYSSVAVSSGDSVICLVVMEGLDNTKLDANAHLIACAPEMYAMLDEISDGLLEVGGFGNCKLAKEIEALLAKARGEK